MSEIISSELLEKFRQAARSLLQRLRQCGVNDPKVLTNRALRNLLHVKKLPEVNDAHLQLVMELTGLTDSQSAARVLLVREEILRLKERGLSTSSVIQKLTERLNRKAKLIRPSPSHLTTPQSVDSTSTQSSARKRLRDGTQDAEEPKSKRRKTKRRSVAAKSEEKPSESAEQKAQSPESSSYTSTYRRLLDIFSRVFGSNASSDEDIPLFDRRPAQGGHPNEDFAEHSGESEFLNALQRVVDQYKALEEYDEEEDYFGSSGSHNHSSDDRGGGGDDTGGDALEKEKDDYHEEEDRDDYDLILASPQNYYNDADDGNEGDDSYESGGGNNGGEEDSALSANTALSGCVVLDHQLPHIMIESEDESHNGADLPPREHSPKRPLPQEDSEEEPRSPKRQLLRADVDENGDVVRYKFTQTFPS